MKSRRAEAHGCLDPVAGGAGLASGLPATRQVATACGRSVETVEAVDPQEPLVLWFLGIAAVQDKRPDIARRYWGTLLAKLPPGSDDAHIIETALGTLPAVGSSQDAADETTRGKLLGRRCRG